MPPSSPSSEDAPHTVGDTASLSDFDVSILHQIVTRAEQQQDVERLPFRAIFAAYDTVLAENGLSSEHDQKYLRFLFRLGEKGRKEATLYEKFEGLLEDIGIQLVYNEDEDDNDEIANPMGLNASVLADPVDETETRDAGWERGRAKRRRASFNSMYDGTVESTKWSTRPTSRSSVSKLQVGKSPFPDSKNKTDRTRSVEPTSSIRGISHARDRMTRIETTEAIRNDHRQRLSELRQNLVNWKSPGPLTALSKPSVIRSTDKPKATVYGETEATSTALGDGSPAQKATLSHQHRPQLFEVPFIRNQRLSLQNPGAQVASDIARQMPTYLDQVREAQEKRAIQRDRWNLLYDAMNKWVTVSRTQRTDQLYVDAEGMVVQRRNKNLLYKAFDQWITVTSHEVNRTAVARRYMLKIKYFRAWRDLTSQNEGRVEQFAIRTPFWQWRKSYVRALANEITAIQRYQENLVKAIFWKWFWAYCDKSAPKLWERKIKSSVFISWLEALMTIRKRDRISDNQKEDRLKQSILIKWTHRSRYDTAMEQEAKELRQRNVLGRCLESWQREAQLAPLAATVSTLRDWRIARVTSARWVLRTRMAQKAVEVDRLRALRNAWTSWNDRLRWQTLAARIDERLVLQALYKWVLMERFQLMMRVHEHRFQERAFRMFVSSYRSKRAQLQRAEDKFQETRNRRSSTNILKHFKVKSHLLQQGERLADQYYAPKLQHQFLEFIAARRHRIKQMEIWAQDAQFYFMTKRAMNLWKDAMTESKRQKRRESYSSVRRFVKMNMATRVIEKWRGRAEALQEANERAGEIYQNKTTMLVSDLLRRWKDRMSAQQHDFEFGDRQYHDTLAKGAFRQWVARALAIRDLSVQADKFSYIHVMDVSGPLLRKLRFRVFEIRTRVENADAMMDRNHRKHVRNMVRHWRDRTSLVQEALITTDFGPSMTLSFHPQRQTPYGADRAAEAAEEFTSLNESFNASTWATAFPGQSSTPMPVPGYLNTPSKRAVRAKALAQISTTPATPTMTPFAVRLRNQFGSGERTGTPKGDLKSAQGGFGRRNRIIEEEESI